MARRAPLKAQRDANEKEVFDALRRHGLTVFALDVPADAIVGYGGTTYLVEVKNGPKAPMTPPQETFLETWKGDHTILRSVDDAILFARGVRLSTVVRVPFRGTIS